MERLTDYLRLANQEAKTARAGGNTPFGAILVDDVTGEVLMRQGNAEGDTHDATAHAEFVLASRASRTYSKEKLWKCTLYTTCEPCPMCTGGIYWANIGRIVYGISEARLLELTGADDKNPTFSMGADKVIARFLFGFSAQFILSKRPFSVKINLPVVKNRSARAGWTEFSGKGC